MKTTKELLKEFAKSLSTDQLLLISLMAHTQKIEEQQTEKHTANLQTRKTKYYDDMHTLCCGSCGKSVGRIIKTKDGIGENCPHCKTAFNGIVQNRLDLKEE